MVTDYSLTPRRCPKFICLEIRMVGKAARSVLSLSPLDNLEVRKATASEPLSLRRFLWWETTEPMQLLSSTHTQDENEGGVSSNDVWLEFMRAYMLMSHK